MVDDQRARAPELQGRPAFVAIALVVIALVAGSWWGWSYAGPLGGLLGILLGTAVGTLAFTIVRMLASSRLFAERSAPDVRGLPPDQAVQVLAAMLGASAGEQRGGPAIGGGLLGEIGKAQTRAEAGDLDGALAKLRGLAEEHARSPAVPAAIVRVLAGNSEHASERLAAARSAIGLALRGGMNRLATQVYEQLDVGERAQLGLDADARAQLGKALSAQGLDALADELQQARE
jgi:hypothetical protein